MIKAGTNRSKQSTVSLQIKPLKQSHKANSMKALRQVPHNTVRKKKMRSLIDERAGQGREAGENKAGASYQIEKLRKENMHIRKGIKQSRRENEENRGKIIKLIKNITLAKIGNTMAGTKQQQRRCGQMCWQELQKQLLLTKQKRYQLEKQHADFLQWQQIKQTEYLELQESLHIFKKVSAIK